MNLRAAVVFLGFLAVLVLFGCARPGPEGDSGTPVSVVPAPVGVITPADAAGFEVTSEECVSGEDAVPNVGFSWKWGEIDETFCSENFLDETQFSICLLKKINSHLEKQSRQDTNGSFGFEAKLMRVSFSADFREDFYNYYTAENFLDTPSFFTDERGLGQLFRDGQKIVFGASEIQKPGRYKITVNGIFSQEQPITVLFEEIETEPFLDNAFYYLNFNGPIGNTQTGFDREGYGLGYNNVGDTVKLSNDFSIAKNQSGTGAFSADISQIVSHEQLNLVPEYRGVALKVFAEPANIKRKVEFAHTIATPLLLEEKATGLQGISSVSTFYNLFSPDGREFFSGDSLLLWQPVGECLDFSGKNSWVFDARNNADPPSYLINYDLRGVPQENRVEGEVFHKTIVYTSQPMSITPLGIAKNSRLFSDAIRISTPVSAESQGSGGQSIALSGTPNSRYNSPSNVTADFEQVFELVKEGFMCVQKSGGIDGLETVIKWNEPRLFEFIASQLESAERSCVKKSVRTVVQSEEEAQASINDIEDILNDVSSDISGIEGIIASQPVKIENAQQAQNAQNDIENALNGLDSDLAAIDDLLKGGTVTIGNSADADSAASDIENTLAGLNGDLDGVENSLR